MDRFRKAYRELTGQEKELCLEIKDRAADLDALIASIGTPGPGGSDEAIAESRRATALARTNLEQSVMWAIKGITG